MTTATQKWFGADFTKLHPLLQELHTTGGILKGAVTITTSNGLSGIIGRRLAKKLNIPAKGKQHQLEVIITHKNNALHWDRRFDSDMMMKSVFTPVGQKGAAGYWTESTGAIQLYLDVDIKDGGWYWQPQKMRIKGVPFPLWLTPRTTAYKRIEQGNTNEPCYRFHVSFSLPFLGTILSYGGLLEKGDS